MNEIQNPSYELVDPQTLVPFPRNSWYFDETQGAAWENFKADIKARGIIDPLVVDVKDRVVVSGNQRLRAARELRLPEVKVVWQSFESEDERLKTMILANLQTRFGYQYAKINPIKAGRCVEALWRIYNVRGPGRQKLGESRMSADEFFEQYGVYLAGSKDQMSSMRNAVGLIEPLQNAVMEQNIPIRAAGRDLAKLSTEEQEFFSETIPAELLSELSEHDFHIMIPIFRDYYAKAKEVASLQEEAVSLRERLSEYHAGSSHTVSEINAALSERDAALDMLSKVAITAEKHEQKYKERAKIDKRQFKKEATVEMRIKEVKKSLNALRDDMVSVSSKQYMQDLKEIEELAMALKVDTGIVSR